MNTFYAHSIVPLLMVLFAVSARCNNVTNITSGGAAHPTIAGALAAALPGDTLLVRSNVYNESLDISKSITIRGSYNAAFTSQNGLTIITNGGSAGSVIDVTGGVDVELERLRVQGGSLSFFGGGLDVRDGSTALVANCQLRNCRASRGGGLYASQPGTLVILSNCEVTVNMASQKGGGVRINDSARMIATGLHTDIVDNEAPEGGGAAIARARCELQDNADLYGNTAATRGGGVLAEDESTFIARGSLTYIGFDASDANRVTNGNGGGVYAINSHVELYGPAVLSGNAASGQGGGIYLSNSTLLADDAAIGADISGSTNEAGTAGGGIFAIHSHVTLTNGTCVIRGVAAVGGGLCTEGGALDAYDVTIGSMSTTLINAATAGAGGMYLNNTTAWFVNVCVQGNQAPPGAGGGAYIVSAVPLTISNVVVQNNDAMQVGGLFLVAGMPTVLANIQVVSNHAAVYGGMAAQFGSDCTIAGSCIQGNSAVDVGGGAGNVPRHSAGGGHHNQRQRGQQ